MGEGSRNGGRAIIVLAGGRSRRFQSRGYDKCLSYLNNQPLLQHTLNRAAEVAVDEIIVAVRERKQGEDIRKRVKIEIDARARARTEFHIVYDTDTDCAAPVDSGPLSGFIAALEYAPCAQCLFIGCDMPFVNPEVLDFLFETSTSSALGYDAVVPCWENGMLEPLHAVYRREATLTAIRNGVIAGERRLSKILARLNVYFLPVAEIREIDPDLMTFTNINTPAELERCAALMQNDEEERRRKNTIFI